MSIIHRIKYILSHIGMEIPLFLYMVSSFLKYPVFQNLLFEKVCLRRYHNQLLCGNVTAYYEDHLIQQDANHMYFLSTLVLIVPSMLSSLLLGSALDVWSTKIPLIIPFIGVILSSTNYIIQTVNMQWNVYLLLASDLMFGACGGFNAIIGTTTAYGVKITITPRHRSIRIAAMEGAMGLGGTIGYAISGTLREAVGYAWAFVVMLIIQVIAFLYIILFAKELIQRREREEPMNDDIDNTTKIIANFVRIFNEFSQLFKKDRLFQTMLNINLLALGIELLVFAGMTDILYSFLRYQLGWGDKEYGWFSGLSYGIATATVITVYPLLRLKGVSDSLLGSFGLFLKIIYLIVLTFVKTSLMAYCVTVLTIGNRFVSTGFRSFISNLTDENEQGKVFSFIALLEGATTLLGSAIYNNLYPKTLAILPGLMILFSAVMLIPSLVILLVSDVIYRRAHAASSSFAETYPSQTQNEEISSNTSYEFEDC